MTKEWELKPATDADVRAFVENLDEDDWHEMKVGFEAESLEEVIADDCDETDMLGRWILYLGGEPCVFMAVIKAENDERGVRVWSHTSKALKRHKKTYVKVMKRALSGAIYRVAPWAERVWAVTWHWHPCVNETIKRVLDAENQGWIPGTQLLIWRLLGVELDLYEARLHAGYVRTQEG